MTTQSLVATKSHFPLGDIVITTNARSILTTAEVTSALHRHARGDWGDLPPQDAESNVKALEKGSRLFSAYGEGKRRFWIITEADRSVTTILLPLDY